MTPKLSVVVHVDVDGRHARVAVTGRLTAVNQQGLHPVLQHARAVFPRVTVDLTAADCPDPHAVAQLCRALDLAAGPSDPVTVLAPPTVPEHSGGPATPALHRARHASAPAGLCRDSLRLGAGRASRCPLVPGPVLPGRTGTRHARSRGSR
jgi:hypothetical protein